MRNPDDADRRETEDEDGRPQVKPDPDLISYRHEVVKPDDELESSEGKAAPEPQTRRKAPVRR